MGKNDIAAEQGDAGAFEATRLPIVGVILPRMAHGARASGSDSAAGLFLQELQTISGFQPIKSRQRFAL